MNGIIGSLILLSVALILIYYLIEAMVMEKWSKEALREHGPRILLILTLIIFAVIFYVGRNPTVR